MIKASKLGAALSAAALVISFVSASEAVAALTLPPKNVSQD